MEGEGKAVWVGTPSRLHPNCNLSALTSRTLPLWALPAPLSCVCLNVAASQHKSLGTHSVRLIACALEQNWHGGKTQGWEPAFGRETTKRCGCKIEGCASLRISSVRSAEPMTELNFILPFLGGNSVWTSNPSHLWAHLKDDIPNSVRFVGLWSLAVRRIEASGFTEMIYWVWQVFLDGYIHPVGKKERKKEKNKAAVTLFFFFFSKGLDFRKSFFPKDLKCPNDIPERFVQKCALAMPQGSWATVAIGFGQVMCDSGMNREQYYWLVISRNFSSVINSSTNWKKLLGYLQWRQQKW